MRRIISGATYDTAKSTEVAKREYEDLDSLTHPGLSGAETLYQNGRGAYFLVDDFEYSRKDRDDEWVMVGKAEFSPMSRDQAQRWLLQTPGVEPINVGDDLELPEEAEGDDDGAATVLVRMPPILKARIEAQAKAAGQSTNEFLIRCAEQCTASKAA